MRNKDSKILSAVHTKAAAALLMIVTVCMAFTGCTGADSSYIEGFTLAAADDSAVQGISYYNSSLEKISQYKYVSTDTDPYSAAIIGNRMYMLSGSGVVIQNLLSGRMMYKNLTDTRIGINSYLNGAHDEDINGCIDKERHMLYYRKFLTEDGTYSVRQIYKAVSLDTWKTVTGRKMDYEGSVLGPVASGGIIAELISKDTENGTNYYFVINDEDTLKKVKTIKVDDKDENGAVAVSQGKAMYFSTDGKVVIYDSKTGKVTKKKSGFSSNVNIEAVTSGRYVFIYNTDIDDDAKNVKQPVLYIYDAAKEKLLSTEKTGPSDKLSVIEGTAVSGDNVYVINGIQKVKYYPSSDGYELYTTYKTITQYRMDKKGKLSYVKSVKMDGIEKRDVNNGQTSTTDVNWVIANS